MVAERRYVLDASAILCLFFREPGADRVEALLPGAFVSAANWAEVVAKLVELGADAEALIADMAELDVEIVPLDQAQAETSGRLRGATQSAGLSLGDRCCLALALQLEAAAVTTDRAWTRWTGPSPRIELVR